MIELTLPTMTCGHCVRTVTETVRKLDANAQVSIDLPSHTVKIETSRPADEIRSALVEEGYAPAP
ncbi:heavy-metal-associated domain-containing protein [Sphaerotilaceae bacterium SBD11-9]